MKIGLALGSGGARGLAHIGVLKALRERNIQIKYISGSSMGAFVGAVYAATESIERLENMSADFTWRKMFRLFMPSLPKAGLIDAAKITQLLEENLLFDTFAELKIPLAIDTTDIERGDLITHTSGNLIEAVRASISIPIIFQPAEIDGKILVDGGLVSPVPVNTVREMGADYVIAINVLDKNKSWMRADKIRKQLEPEEPSNFRQLLKRINLDDKIPERRTTRERNLSMLMVIAQTVGITISMMADYQLQVEKPDLLIQPDTRKINVYDFHRGEDVIPAAYELTN
ncbi:MAG: patatin-like phospholipase family protein [Candidatus Marinimicrobia bacterium]|nr:patatin-like phospholipase family protein [Candidatus Neomarinimicrobiota bacterium]MCF7828192.1 patatin-like phospholipase family protein [Candidatus Neomarinimicrobiota bacterium]MCF7879633.1 patatin-like phospholipase family protein [Candidatus Neomarinimicrobiota bacterium]